MRTIAQPQEEREIGYDLALNFTALILFGTYTDQWTTATMKKLIIKNLGDIELRKARNRCSIVARQAQDATLILLHPQVLQAIEQVLKGRSENK